MSARLPYHILPTATILAAPYPSSTTPVIVSTVSRERDNNIADAPIKKQPLYLDDEQGKKVIALIHARGGTIGERKKESEEDDDDDDEDSDGGHQKTFFTITKEKKKKKKEEVIEEKSTMDLIDKMNSFLKIDAKGLVKYIDLQVLVENEITLEDLITLCGVGICDLKAANIVNDANDLFALKFKMSDLVLNRELFRAQHLRDLFQLTYEKLAKIKSVKCNTYNLLSCQFHTNELEALSFSFDRLISDNMLNDKQLLALNFKLEDLISLHFNVQNFRALGISRRQALDEFGWDRAQYALFTGEPEFNKAKKKKKG